MIDWDAMLTRDNGNETRQPAPSDSDDHKRGQCPKILARQQAGDDRRRCSECANLAAHGLCLASHRGEIQAGHTYRPTVALLRRCEAFSPLPSDCDQRPGRERWPELGR